MSESFVDKPIMDPHGLHLPGAVTSCQWQPGWSSATVPVFISDSTLGWAFNTDDIVYRDLAVVVDGSVRARLLTQNGANFTQMQARVTHSLSNSVFDSCAVMPAFLVFSCEQTKVVPLMGGRTG